MSRLHRAGVYKNENGSWVAACSCGWRETFHWALAARREVKAHRRYPDGNPRLKGKLREVKDA